MVYINVNYVIKHIKYDINWLSNDTYFTNHFGIKLIDKQFIDKYIKEYLEYRYNIILIK